MKPVKAYFYFCIFIYLFSYLICDDRARHANVCNSGVGVGVVVGVGLSVSVFLSSNRFQQ